MVAVTEFISGASSPQSLGAIKRSSRGRTRNGVDGLTLHIYCAVSRGEDNGIHNRTERITGRGEEKEKKLLNIWRNVANGLVYILPLSGQAGSDSD